MTTGMDGDSWRGGLGIPRKPPVGETVNPPGVAKSPTSGDTIADRGLESLRHHSDHRQP